MWKIVFFFAVIIAAASITMAAPSKNYPHSLIGEDFGILNEEDLAINTCTALPEPFSKDSISFPYWQCFETKYTNFLCDGGAPDPKEGPQAFMVFQASNKSGTHEYIARRPWELSECREFGMDYKKLTRNISHVCFSGSFISMKKDNADTPLTSWVFESFKTNKGCKAYFVGGCSLKYQIKHGCKIKEQSRLQFRGRTS
ncbi:MAG: hypothetical protein A2583_10335 [Bdellovibrionales bacterium RIFOXYD1_FULL_53_11]|nr:MAG: hypothetical protein A2583_10335 [Bdellovibrionales bacterium RIFOXYD1_FULL_53_11]